MKNPSELQTKLKKADPIVRDYVRELKKRNAKLQSQIVKLEADKDERDGRIKALGQQLKEKKVDLHYGIGIAPRNEDELIAQLKGFIPRLIEIAPKLGLKIEEAS
ncbi:MAG TPA: hypothetical protein VJO54_05930 [Burkholderiales bacterium]|nr:hypothetical protein [Burkholderiales bacterium]